MTPKKVWTLHGKNASYSDATYIVGLGCSVEVTMPEWQEFTSAGGMRGRYLAEDLHIEITTTCEKQESMLYLKYGDELRLVFSQQEWNNENFNLV
jgi:hypothetical protein